MGHTPYGYKIVNGLAVIDEVEGAAVKKLYEGYLGGLGLQAAADEAGISINHCQAKRMMLNKKSDEAQDMYFNLYNNIWGCNQPMWYCDDSRFRFLIKAE